MSYMKLTFASKGSVFIVLIHGKNCESLVTKSELRKTGCSVKSLTTDYDQASMSQCMTFGESNKFKVISA